MYASSLTPVVPTLLPAPRAVSAAPIPLALELERVRYPGDARNPARDVHGTIYRIGRPDVTGECAPP